MILVCNPDQLPFATALTSRRPPRPEMLVIAKACFRICVDGTLERLPLRESSVSGDTFDPKALDASGEVLAPSDFAHAKLRPEVMVRATCHTPKGRAMRECPASVSVGQWSKHLRVVGKRLWMGDALGGVSTEPLPFTTMPVTWANAFGSPEHAMNPVGLGGPKSTELPRIELLNHPIAKRGTSFTPAGLGPLNPMWPYRAAKMGRAYGDDWKAKRAPFVAEDFDWTFHQSAPPDQWLEALRGDEPLVFENLHPERSLLRTRLPAKRVVVHARRRSAGLQGGPVVLVPMTLDTLFVDLEASTLSLTWRGHLSVREHDLSDVHSLLVTFDDLDAKARSLAEVERELSTFEADPAGLAAMRSEIDARFRALDQDLPEVPEAISGPPDAISAKLDGLFADDSFVKRSVRANMAAALSGPGGDKLAEELAKLDAAAELAAAGAAPAEPPIPRGSPTAAPSSGLRRRMRPVAEQIAKIHARSDVSDRAKQQASDAEATLRDPQFAKADPEYSYPEPLSTEEAGPGANLIDRDFTDLSLANFDLRGAKLDGAVFTRADLRGVDLTGASLRGALFFSTNLEGALFTDTDATRANFAYAQAQNARFDRAQLTEAFFQRADLTGASFVGAQGTWTVFERAVLRRADLSEARFERADFGEAILDGSRLLRATLATCLFERAIAIEADFSESDLQRCVFRDAVLLRARLVRVLGSRSSFDGADLAGADLSLATFRHTHFAKASFRGAEAYGADFFEARLYRADLSDAVFEEANLFGADLIGVRVDRTSFVSANLYDATLLEAAGENANFRGANLEGCRSSTARRVEVDT